MKSLPPTRTERELTGILNRMGIATRPEPETRLYALLPDPVDSTMAKALMLGRLRSNPNLPVAVSASINRRLLRKRPKQAPVVFIKSKPAYDWRRDLMAQVDKFERSQMVFVDRRFCTGAGCFDLS